MNFELTDEQSVIQETARELLAARLPAARLHELAEAGTDDDALWDELCGLGWAGLAIAEEHGGQGLGVLELALLSEEVGAALAPLPLFGAASAALVIGEAGSEDQRARLLPRLAAGTARGAVAEIRSGEPRLCADALGAEALVVIDDGHAHLAGPDAAVEPEPSIDMTRRYAMVHADGGEPLPGDPAPALDRAEVLLAAELTGVARRALEGAVRYASDREQFGRPIGTFQGVSHRCARMLLLTEGSRSLTLYAAWTADHEPESLALAASAAKLAACKAAIAVTESALHVHGGIGFTWEHESHLLLKRARAGVQLLGAPAEHRARVTALRRVVLSAA